MKHAVLGLVTFISLIGLPKAHADNSSEAYRTICESMVTDVDRRACLNAVKSAVEFEHDTLLMCSDMVMSKTKIDCLYTIGDKVYFDFEVSACKAEVMEAGKMACLKNNGRSTLTIPCRVDRDVVAQFEEIRKLMAPQTLSNAVANLDKMLVGMRKCY